MKLIINIDDNVYNNLKSRGLTGMLTSEECECMNKSIYNGIPLPKGHGRLIDENDVVKIYDIDANVWWENALGDIKDKELVPTIIEADTESEE